MVKRGLWFERLIESSAFYSWWQAVSPSMHSQARVIELSKRAVFDQVHLPNSQWLDARRLLKADAEGNARGLLPDAGTLSALFETLGLTPDTAVIASDDEGGAWASRLLWSLEMMGHRGSLSLLDGGIHGWLAAGLPTQEGQADPVCAGGYPLPAQMGTCRATAQDIVAIATQAVGSVRSTATQLWDTRSYEEYTGQRQLARRAGHIPSARWLEWSELFDRDNALRLRNRDQIEQRLHEQGITPDSALIVYCQSHHRSSLAYWVARWLGREVRAYDGSWSEWGNRLDLPVHSGAAP